MSDGQEKEPKRMGAFTQVALHESELEMLGEALQLLGHKLEEGGEHEKQADTFQLWKHLKRHLDDIRKRTARSDPGTRPGDA